MCVGMRVLRGLMARIAPRAWPAVRHRGRHRAAPSGDRASVVRPTPEEPTDEPCQSSAGRPPARAPDWYLRLHRRFPPDVRAALIGRPASLSPATTAPTTASRCRLTTPAPRG